MRFGIAGAGNIVPDFLAAQSKVTEITPYAICASRRSEERMRTFAARYGIERVYYSYDEMLEDPDIEVIYIAVPNILHYEFARRALERHLHVICEKPFCNSADEVEDLIMLAQTQDLYLFEAITNQYLPNYDMVRELVPTLGNIRIVELNFSQYSSRYDRFLAGDIAPAFDPAKKGGVLRDLNIYNIHFVVGLFGEPTDVTYYPNIQRGIDTSGTLILRYPSFICTLTAAKDSDAPCRISIQGEQGYLVSHSKANSFDEFIAKYRQPARETSYALNAEPERLYYELRAFADMVNRGDREFCQQRLEHSLAAQRVLDLACSAVG